MPALEPSMSTPDPVNLPALSRRKAVAFAAMGSVIVATGTILWLWNPDAEGKAILNLPQMERRALYERTLRTLETTCRSKASASGLEDFCRGQAEFIVRFPECDAVCSALAEPRRSLPSR